MRRIRDHALRVGNCLGIADLKNLHNAGVQGFVNLALHEPLPALTRELIYCRIPLIDGAGNRPEFLKLAVEATAQLIQAKLPTLVFCSAGMSRSPAVAAAAIACVSGRCPGDCLADVFAGGPGDLAGPHWNDLLIILAHRPA